MVQDFAKSYAPKEPEAPGQAAGKREGSPVALLLTGLFTGLALGLFISFLAYLSGYVPPLPGEPRETVAQNNADAERVAQEQLNEELERAAQRLQLEFYQELPNYEVVVDATPLTQRVASSAPPPVQRS